MIVGELKKFSLVANTPLELEFDKDVYSVTVRNTDAKEIFYNFLNLSANDDENYLIESNMAAITLNCDRHKKITFKSADACSIRLININD